jgi:carbon monoxide dehydrogenase subunit G
MRRATASHEVLASPEDVWNFVADPGHFGDWWPGIAAVEPDRRGLAPGARWIVRADVRPTLLKSSGYSGVMVIREVHPCDRLNWTLTGDRWDVELRLEGVGPDRTMVTLEVTAGWLVPLPRSLARRALTRLYNLCQTAAAVE